MLWPLWISIKRYNMTKNDIKEWFHKITAEDFFKRLDHACQTDSTHWGLRTGSIGDYFYRGTGEPTNEGESMYSYFIYPDQTPVDRSRGM